MTKGRGLSVISVHEKNLIDDPRLALHHLNLFQKFFENRPRKEAVISFVTDRTAWSWLLNKSYLFIIVFPASITYVP